ncbi:FHF complex subunit HOOK interacting protein 1B-like isoform X2 [Daphnia pulex]|uniref:FHF complex subunit HOOK interacting protein 1B-like isoform X2 n=1 Tax=Daphnia pulex TaxID=6669 RepID=UPI001EE0CFA4|nr:FHF complex subunit HOOK interacting protein 1B-like isoform X2 [Daphnia pulex]
MNFIRNNFGGSLRRRQENVIDNRDNSQINRGDDSDACFETYRHHCTQLEETISSYNRRMVPADDFELIIISHLEHLVNLVVKDVETRRSISGPSACLDHFLSKNIISTVCNWSLENDHDGLLIAIAGAIDAILAAAKKVDKDLELLRNPSFHLPISQLFKRYEVEKVSGKCVSAKIEALLVSISYYVCVFIVREPSYLDLFYDIATIAVEPKFPLMTLLICNLHKCGAQGQTSRDNLKLLMALAKEHQLLAQFIALHSDLCPIVATGLSAVFSDLPRPLPGHIEKAGMLSAMDIESLKEVENFVTSLEFCDSVLETSSWLIVNRLLDMCYKGFLVPVLGPALFQNTMKEIFAATCYLTLMIRRIRNRGLIGIFIRFLFVNTHEEQPIIGYLIKRMSAETELRLATLNLFYALVELNCEDVMLVLAMRHLLPCTHVMLSQRGDILQESDTNCLWAAKFLSLVPIACNAPALDRKRVADLERNSHESEPLSRIRSWSRTNNDTGERSYGHLSFTTSEKKLALSDQIISNDCVSSDLDFTRFRRYLKDQFNQIGPCVDAVRCWTYRYNGSSPPIKEAIGMLYNSSELEEPIRCTGASSQVLNLPEKQADQTASSPSSQYPLVDPADIYMYCMEQLTTCLSEMKSNSASPGQSSGYYSINCNLQPNDLLKEEATFFSKEVQDDLEFWSLMRDDDFDSTPIVTPVVRLDQTFIYQPNLPSIGPFLENLVKSIDGWLSNSIEVNIALCSILSRLATYSHPLLRSLILNPYLILQPSIPSLAVCIATLKQRIDSALKVHENQEKLMEEARLALQARLSRAALQVTRDPISKERKHKPSKFAGILNSFVRKDVTDSIKEEDSERYHLGSNNHRQSFRSENSENSDPIGNHVAMCAVLLEEWLLELAALCMEQAVQFTPFTIPLTLL